MARARIGPTLRRVAAACAAAALGALPAACSRPPEPPAKSAEPPPAAPAAKAPAPVFQRPPSPTLAAVKARGRLRCGVHPDLPGFAYRDNADRWRGFDVDLCRALAAAVLGDAGKSEMVPVSTRDRFAAVREGRVDVLMRSTSWTLTRDVAEGVDWAAVTYYDGQGFLAPRSLNLQTAQELDGARICVQAATTSQVRSDEWFRARNLAYTGLALDGEVAARQAYETGECDVLTADVSQLAAARSAMSNPGAHVLLPEVISKEPLGLVVGEGDAGWREVVRWTFDALLLAEELGITAANAEAQAADSLNPEARRLLGADPGAGAGLGLDEQWALRAVQAGGNYGEIFNRELGQASPLRLERGLNALWNASPRGLMYPLPIR